MLAAKKTAAILGLALFAAIVGSEVRIFAQRTEPVEARQPDEPDVLAVAQEALKNEEPKDERLDRFGDRLPVGAIARLGTLRFRHSHFVSGLAYTPDGKSLASACWDGAVRLWDAETGKMTRSFQHDPDRQTFTLVAITPDGKTLVNIEGGASVRIWELESGKERRSMKLGNGFALALSHDGKIVAKGVSCRLFSRWPLGRLRQL